MATERELLLTAIEQLVKVANQCTAWAIESQSGGWSTHQVQPNNQLAGEIWTKVAYLRRAAGIPQ